jgi:translation initiation factor IF-2
MSEQDQERKTPLKLAQPGKLELKKTVETGQVRQSFSHGRSKVVTVEVRKKRTFAPGAGGAMHEVREGAVGAEAELAQAVAKVEAAQKAASVHDLTSHEKQARARALQDALKAEEDARQRAEEEAVAEAEARKAAEEARRVEEEERARAEEEARQGAAEAEAAAPAPSPAARFRRGGARPTMVR